MPLPWLSGTRRVKHKALLQLPFYGREALLTTLETHLQNARAGTAQFVTLEGPAGSGKSTLLSEFVLGRCPRPFTLLIRLNAGSWVVTPECYTHFFTALQTQSEKVLSMFYNDTKRLRKMVAVNWDEPEFRAFLSSTAWTQVQEHAPAPASGATRRPDALGQLLTMAREHPWAVGATTIIDVMARDAALGRQHGALQQRWHNLLQTLNKRGLPQGAVCVVLLEQLADYPQYRDQWVEHWRDFVRITAESALPLLVIWTGTPEALQPVRQAGHDQGVWTTHRIEGLATEEVQALLPRLLRVLPRSAQSTWGRLVAADAVTFGNPAYLLLSTTCAAAAAQEQPPSEQLLSSIATASTTELIARLLEHISQQPGMDTGLLRQLTEICAFFPPGEEVTMDDLFLYCDLEAAGREPVPGRVAFEKLAGAFVRFGLLSYDPYTAVYTTGNCLVQQALQAYVYPADGVRHTIARRRAHAAAVLRHVQHEQGDVLQQLARQIETEEGHVMPSLLAPYLVPPLRRLLARSTKAERQQMASALGKFPSLLAVEMLATLLEDEDGQVRSRAIQSIADLEGLDTLPALLTALKDTNGDVRWIAALALGKMERAETVDALIALLTDEDKEVGRIAAEGLGQKGDRRAVPHLIAAMRDSYPLLRESAALALGQLADARALPALQELLKDANMQVRRCAELALARLSPST